MTRPPEQFASLVGAGADLGRYRISWSRLALAHSLIWSISELHTSVQPPSVGAEPKGPMATGPWVAALVCGLFRSRGGTDLLRAHGIELEAMIDVETGYHAPVYGGDEIAASCQVTSIDPDAEIVTVQEKCTNLDGQPLLTTVRRYRYSRLPS